MDLYELAGYVIAIAVGVYAVRWEMGRRRDRQAALAEARAHRAGRDARGPRDVHDADAPRVEPVLRDA
jgi:hypothetical protein